MPGYLISQSGSAQVNNFSAQESSDINEAYDKIFYGFRVDPSTGKLFVDEINDNTMSVNLPDTNILNPLDYKTWIWSKNQLIFSWNATKKTNMNMEML